MTLQELIRILQEEKQMDKLELLITQLSKMKNPCIECREKNWVCYIVSCGDYGSYAHAQDKLYQLGKGR